MIQILGMSVGLLLMCVGFISNNPVIICVNAGVFLLNAVLLYVKLKILKKVL